MKDVAALSACNGQAFKGHLGTAAQLLVGFIGHPWQVLRLPTQKALLLLLPYQPYRPINRPIEVDISGQ